jgi:hypothetical protein
MTPDTKQPTEYTDERIAELREEFALPDTFDPNTFPPTKTKGMKASISGTARNGKRFIDEGEYDTAKGYFEFFDDMAHQLNQGYYDAAVIINKLLAEIERLRSLTLPIHGPEEKPEPKPGTAIFRYAEDIDCVHFDELLDSRFYSGGFYSGNGTLVGYYYDDSILHLFEQWQKGNEK